jgi:hypothetical protein
MHVSSKDGRLDGPALLRAWHDRDELVAPLHMAYLGGGA